MKKRTLYDLFGPNPTEETMEIMKQACEQVCEYWSYVHHFVPTIEQPHPMSDDEYFKKQEKRR